ncbi:MAG TPA: histidine kinase, partial [Solirubrobacteraceae bacterium]|nr:histidine kinase [Solirubrobacteraceae bacterium]
SYAGIQPNAGERVRSPREPRRFEGLNRAGLLIVAVASLIQSLNQTSQSLVVKPFAEWLGYFFEALQVNFVIGLGLLLAAVWARHLYARPGRAQYASAFVAVCVAAFLAAAALEANFLIDVVMLLAAIWVSRYPGRAQYAGAFMAVALAICLASLTLELGPGTSGPFPVVDYGLSDSMLSIAQDLARYAVVGMVIAGAWLYTRTEADHSAAIAQCAVDSARMDEQTAEARLQMLEAQIEPHFLFNTLAHVKRLYETDRAAGTRMLRNLKAYLAVALPQMRATGSTLGRELDHVMAYLDIQQIRMGRRLAYAIDADDALRRARFPPLMLLTLVENAIKHGLSPVPAGGRIDVRARIEADRLRVEVADTGGGFTKSGGAGAGLANIRARLAAQFGQDASLTLALNSPRGVVATIALPYVPARAEAHTL